MIGVNNLNAPTITLVRREPVNCQEAESRFNVLVTNDEDTTFDPAIINQSPPHGKKYDFKKNQGIEFFRDNAIHEEKPIYLIALTNNRDVFTNGKRGTRRAYDKLKENNKNPLFGRWTKPTEAPDGTALRIIFLDTVVAETNILTTEALELQEKYRQDAIIELHPTGWWLSI